jgi:anti-anti-sigma factor
MYRTIEEQEHESYTLFTPTDLDSPEFRDLPSLVSDLLLASKRDIVLSLSHIDTVLSSHLSVLVQLYQLLRASKQRFVIVNACEAVTDILEMTQLSTLLTLFPTLDDYLASLPPQPPTPPPRLDFTWQSRSLAPDHIEIDCRGYLVHGAQMQAVKEAVAGKHDISFKFARVSYIDMQTLLWLDELAGQHRVTIHGASEALKELFLQNGMQGKFIYEDE